jgi:TRAP-type uncharacterized transport system fused permease subunit
VRIAGGSTPALLLMGAITSLILGVGMTVTACYVFLAIVLAPALATAGLNTLAVHLFLMYWGMISFITPPVSVGAYAAASVAHSSPMRTGFQAMRLGAVIYFIPFFFVLNPVLVLQDLTLMGFLTAFSLAVVGIALVAGGLQGYIVGVGPLGEGLPGWLTRALLVVGGVLIGWPGSWLTIIGTVLSVPILLVYFIINQRKKNIPQTV